jgi:hypothetical protein
VKERNTRSKMQQYHLTRTPCNNTKNTPNVHKRSSKNFFYYSQNVVANTCNKIYNEKMGERMKRMGEIWAA